MSAFAVSIRKGTKTSKVLEKKFYDGEKNIIPIQELHEKRLVLCGNLCHFRTEIGIKPAIYAMKKLGN